MKETLMKIGIRVPEDLHLDVKAEAPRRRHADTKRYNAENAYEEALRTWLAISPAAHAAMLRTGKTLPDAVGEAINSWLKGEKEGTHKKYASSLFENTESTSTIVESNWGNYQEVFERIALAGDPLIDGMVRGILRFLDEALPRVEEEKRSGGENSGDAANVVDTLRRSDRVAEEARTTLRRVDRTQLRDHSSTDKSKESGPGGGKGDSDKKHRA